MVGPTPPVTIILRLWKEEHSSSDPSSDIHEMTSSVCLCPFVIYGLATQKCRFHIKYYINLGIRVYNTIGAGGEFIVKVINVAHT